MQILLKKLHELKKSGKAINVFVIGAGFMGGSLISQLNNIDGFKCNIASSKRNESVVDIINKIGGREIRTIEEKVEYNSDDAFFVAGNPYEFIDHEKIDIVVDATGSTYEGAKIAYQAILAKKDVVSFNVECDVVIGPYLSKLAKKMGVCYTGIAGDEPGSVKEMYDFAEFLGFEVVAIGKGKNNPLDFSADYESCHEDAIKKGLSPRMLATFVDGSKTMEELTMMCNATGFIPDKIGAHGIESDIKTLDEKIKLKKDGGILEKEKIADFVFGIAPGVFIAVRTNNEVIDHEMRFLKIGKGPNYILYRPFHLTSIEAPISIAQAYFFKIPTIAPLSDKPFADTIAVAKRDLKAGDHLDFAGGKTIYGTIVEYNYARDNDYLPYGFVSEEVILKKDVNRGELLKYSDVILPESILLELRQRMEKGLD